MTFAQTPVGQILAEQSLRKLGQQSFVKNCSGCHGLKGDASTASSFLNPKPRDLTKGVFKFRSTPNGTLPTDEDLLRTLTLGVLGTSMPSFRLVPQQELLAIIEYIKTLSPSWDDPSLQSSPVNLPAPPADLFKKKSVFIKRAESGKQIFAMSCALCHGYGGHGDGPAAQSLKDENDNVIQAIDLTRPFVKSGWGAQDIYRAMATGLNGTPMAAFAEALGEEKTWDVVAFVMYLRGESMGLYDVGTIAPIPPPPVEPADEAVGE